MYITMILIMFFVVPLVLTTRMYKNEAIIELNKKIPFEFNLSRVSMVFFIKEFWIK